MTGGFDKPIVRESLAEAIAHRILDQIISGALKPGDQIPAERDLAESLNVSRPSVREAIRGLSILGVVRSRHGGGAYISDLDAASLLGPIRFFLSLETKNIAELYDARSLIESNVARRAAVNIDDATLVELGRILDDQADTLKDAGRFRASDLAFHSAIWAAADNAFLHRIAESLNVLGLEFRQRASENAHVLEQSLRDHHVLLDALAARDAEAAAQAAERHMQNVYKSTVGDAGA